MSKAKKNRIVELRVSELSSNGNGFALFEENGSSFQVEIPFTVPGDLILAKLLKNYRGVCQAELVKVLESSPLRKPSICSHFGVCGGCRFQHISYEHQLEHKEAFVRKCFESLLTPEVTFCKISACEKPWLYRNKMEYTFDKDPSGKKVLGMIKDGTIKSAFNIHECHLVGSWFIDAVNCVRNWWEATDVLSYHYNTGTLQTLTLREGQSSKDRMVILSVSGHPDWALEAKLVESFVNAVRKTIEQQDSSSQLSIFLRIKQAEEGVTTSMYDMLLYGPGYIRETLNIQIKPEDRVTTINFQIGSSDFFQPNPRQTEKFYSNALNLAKIPSSAIVYDLYCATGTLGICLSKHVKQVVGIEFWPDSAANARNNAKHNGCHNVSIFSGAVRHTLHRLPKEKIPPPDVVMVNPPRSGLDSEAMQHLLALNPQKILYISCNPSTQALNVAHLQGNGYRLVAIQPVDQFPQTNHVECVVVLER